MEKGAPQNRRGSPDRSQRAVLAGLPIELWALIVGHCHADDLASLVRVCGALRECAWARVDNTCRATHASVDAFIARWEQRAPLATPPWSPCLVRVSEVVLPKPPLPGSRSCPLFRVAGGPWLTPPRQRHILCFFYIFIGCEMKRRPPLADALGCAADSHTHCRPFFFFSSAPAWATREQILATSNEKDDSG